MLCALFWLKGLSWLSSFEDGNEELEEENPDTYIDALPKG